MSTTTPTPLLLLLLLLLPSLSALITLKVGAILEAGDEGALWPGQAKETLQYARDNIEADQEIRIELVYIEADCNTKTGLIQSTMRVVDIDQSDSEE